MRAAACALALAAATLGVVSAAAGALPLPDAPDLDPAGWQEVLFRDRAPVAFTPAGEDDGIAIRAEAAASMLAVRLRVDPAARACLSWRWRLDETTMPPTDLGRRGGDDRNLIVAVGFAHDPARRSLGQRLRYDLARLRAGREIPGRVIFYVWGGAHAVGSWMESPYMDGAGLIRVVEPALGPVGAWRSVQVDVAADYRARFGEAPPAVVELAIGADSDDTASRTSGRIADLAFRPGC
jgi:hypothetical protein